MKGLTNGHHVVGVDSFTPYYDVSLKEARFAKLAPHNTFLGERVDLADAQATKDLFQQHRFERVIHLAAQPGVRFVDPQPYAASNLMGFMNPCVSWSESENRHSLVILIIGQGWPKLDRTGRTAVRRSN